MTEPEGFYVLDAEDRIVLVGGALHDPLDAFLGHTIWEVSPGVRPILGPGFEEARRSGRAVELTSYYAGRVATRRIVPSRGTLTVHVRPLAEIDVTTLATLAASLRRVEAALGAGAPGQPGRPARASLQALS